MPPNPIGIDKESIEIRRADFARSDAILNTIQEGSIYFFTENPQVYLSVESVVTISNAEDISDIDSVTPFMFNSSSSQQCTLCGSSLGESNIFVVGKQDTLRVAMHDDCLFEFGEYGVQILEENPHLAISECI